MDGEHENYRSVLESSLKSYQPCCLLTPTYSGRPPQPTPQAVLLAVSPKVRCRLRFPQLLPNPPVPLPLPQSLPRAALWAPATLLSSHGLSSQHAQRSLCFLWVTARSKDKALSKTHSCMLPRVPSPAQGKPSSRSAGGSLCRRRASPVSICELTGSAVHSSRRS